MPKFTFHGSYIPRLMRRVSSKVGDSDRLKAIEVLAASLGGSIESAYWAIRVDDIYITADPPDNKAAAGLSMTVGASGAVAITAAELFSAPDVDELVGRHGTYRAPGRLTRRSYSFTASANRCDHVAHDRSDEVKVRRPGLNVSI